MTTSPDNDARAGNLGDPEATADRLHSAAIHLLRLLRRADPASGLSGPRLSALSVVVFAGPISMGDLAQAEQVSPATVSRMIKEMEHDGLVKRVVDLDDARVQRVRATRRGRRVLEKGRERRIRILTELLEELPARDRATLDRAAELLERITRPSD